ncbi:response regulator transcription factor [Paenibacillus aurantius]|uniref:Response regulator transcription factor n=1 Tax=Paenibacillus aurantius TaxID=2918900 RepID=A0AA96LB73_9BACL|nr:response regulator transcription factor [Paenibacillus aurantius]WNQ10476.1 response regulator transcription factor [Paenibacillus aurantius]
MFRIMLVEDDERIRSIAAETLRKWQYEVIELTAFGQVKDDYERHQPHLVILDINLPVYDGFHWCQQIRSVSKVPILFLSSRSENLDIIMAINMGGDDFIQKPFDLGVLVAKVSALLRRNYMYQEESQKWSHRDLSFHLSNSTVEYGGRTAELSRNEFILMQAMMRRIGRIVSREDLMQALWNDDQFVDDNTLTVNVNRLRRKLSDLGLESFIATRKGMGYIIE